MDLRSLLMSVFLAGLVFGSGCTTAPRQIDPEADQALKAMSDTLAAANSFSYESSQSMDQKDENGRMVRISRQGRIIVSRPDKAYAEVSGDDGRRALWYDGGSLTLMDKDSKEYAVIEVPDSIDRMLDHVMEEYDVTFPLADLLFPDPYSVLTDKVQTGTSLGKDLAGGQECQHLLFTQENVDWQIWIEIGKQPLPRKVVITMKKEPGSPQFVALLDKWNLAAAPAADTFVFQAPKDAKEVPISELLGEDESNSEEE